MRVRFFVAAVLGWILVFPLAFSRGAETPEGLASEHSLPNRHVYVVQDVLKFCNPRKGFWVDLGAGKGQVSIPLVEATGNPVLMIDPNAESLTEGLKVGKEKKLDDRLSAVIGVAEALPLPDNAVDLVVSRGSIFFWEDPAKGLKEVYRVLRPGGKAYVGGGAGSGYPKWAVEKLIEGRNRRMQGDEADRWNRFVELRRPEQMKKWAEEAGLGSVRIMGKGAVSDDEQIGQGVWLLLEKPADSSAN